MKMPKSTAEYNALFKKNKRLEICEGNTFVHLPCPFCASPNWIIFNILGAYEALVKGATCRTCKRTARAVVVNRRGGSRSIMRTEMFKVAGPKQPGWMDPQMRQLKLRRQ